MDPRSITPPGAPTKPQLIKTRSRTGSITPRKLSFGGSDGAQTIIGVPRGKAGTTGNDVETIGGVVGSKAGETSDGGNKTGESKKTREEEDMDVDIDGEKLAENSKTKKRVTEVITEHFVLYYGSLYNEPGYM